MTIAAILLTGVGSLAAFAGWVLPRPVLPAAAAALALAGAGLLTTLDPEPVSDTVRGLFVVVACVLAVLGGGPVTVGVFSLVDGRAAAAGRSLRSAGDVLRGGAWIGGLERAAVFVCLVAGWPAGLAVLLALKGLGRYPELRVQEDSGAAERFIIGTLTSALWAVACAGLALAG
jgi:hypothetical protein